MSPHLAESPSQTHTTQDHHTAKSGKKQKTIIYANQDYFLLLYFKVIRNKYSLTLYKSANFATHKIWKSKSLEQRATEVTLKNHILWAPWEIISIWQWVEHKSNHFPQTPIQFLKPWIEVKLKELSPDYKRSCFHHTRSFSSSSVFQGQDGILQYWEKLGGWGGAFPS